jgi:hypothetical protein
MSQALSLAGFQVTLIGRFWVTAEVQNAKIRRFEELNEVERYGTNW